jgi:hypothetical protein
MIPDAGALARNTYAGWNARRRQAQKGRAVSDDCGGIIYITIIRHRCSPFHQKYQFPKERICGRAGAVLEDQTSGLTSGFTSFALNRNFFAHQSTCLAIL